MVRILAAEVPNAPAVPFKIESSKTHIKIGFVGSTYTGGVPIESYNVYARLDSEADFTLQETISELSDLTHFLTVPS